MTSNIKNNMLKLAIGMSLASSVSMLQAQDSLKQHIEKEGFKFVQQIQAPAQMTGWAGHIEQSPATVFISNDQKYYIVGTLFDAQGNNLTVDALYRYVKKSILEDVRQSLEHATWIQDGQTSAEISIGGKVRGAFSYFLWKEIRAGGTRSAIMSRVCKQVAALGLNQIPQLEASKAEMLQAPFA